MKAMLLHAYGDADQMRLGEVARPVPGAGEVLIEVRAAGLNPIDLYWRMGALKDRIPLVLPAVLGLDVAGTVAEVGVGSDGFAAGDRVVALLPVGGTGALAEFAVAKLEGLTALPDALDFTTGATLPLVGLTGRQGIDALGIGAGDRVLVTGALGAVGRIAVQYLRELGAVPVAGVRASRLDEGRALADEAVATDGDAGGAAATFDAAFDVAAGGAATAVAAALVRDGGALVSAGGDVSGLDGGGRIRVERMFAVANAARLRGVVAAAASGDLAIPVERTYPLAEAASALASLEGGPRGKVIVLV